MKSGSGDGPDEAKPTNKLASKIQPSGVPFEARARSRPATSEPVEDGADPGLDDPESDLEDSEEIPKSDALARKRRGRVRPQVMRLLRWRIPVGLALGVSLVLVYVTASMTSDYSRQAERARMLAEVSRQGAAITRDQQNRLDKALKDLRESEPEKALKELILLEKEAPEAASLAYLVALAALQTGQPELSAQYIEKSITRRERVSDAIALKAVLEAQRGPGSQMGDPRLRAEGYLRQAMLADSANAAPLVELATLLRYRNENEEAHRILEAARARLNPVDSHTVVDVSICLLDLQEKPDEQLPKAIDPNQGTSSLFSAAYLAMRRGNFPEAAQILKTARERLSSDLYFYLVNDPALRKYAREKELAGSFD